MKKLFRTIFRKSDEMEMDATFKAGRVSSLYTDLFLTVWIFVSTIRTGKVPLVPFILLLSGYLIFNIVRWVLIKRMSGDSDNDQ